jgi:hypothetical protein
MMLKQNKVARMARAWSAVVANVAKAVYYLAGLVVKWGG